MIVKNFKIKKNERKIHSSYYSRPHNISQDLSLSVKSSSINDLICASPIGRNKSKTMITNLISTSKDLIINKNKYSISTKFPKKFRHFYPFNSSCSSSMLNFSNNIEKTKLILSPRINDSYINSNDYISPKSTLLVIRQSSAKNRNDYNAYNNIRKYQLNIKRNSTLKNHNFILDNKKKLEINKNNLNGSKENDNQDLTLNDKTFKIFIDKMNENQNYIHKCKNKIKEYFTDNHRNDGNKSFFEEFFNDYRFDEHEDDYFLTDFFSVKKNSFSIEQLQFSFKITSLQFIFYEILEENIRNKNVDAKIFYDLDKDINLKYNINSKIKFPFVFLPVFYGIDMNEFIYLLISIIKFDYDINKFTIDQINFIAKTELGKTLYDFYTETSFFYLYNHNNSKEFFLYDWEVKNEKNNSTRHFVLKILLPQMKINIKCGEKCKVKFFSNINIKTMGDLIKNNFNNWDYYLLINFCELKLFRFEINKILCGKYLNKSQNNADTKFKKNKNIKIISFNLNPINIILNTIKKIDKSYSFFYSCKKLKIIEPQTFYINLKLPQITISYQNSLYSFTKKFDIDFKRLSQINKLRKSFLPEDLIKFSMNIIKGKNKENEKNKAIPSIKKYLSKKSTKSFRKAASLVTRDKSRFNSKRSNDSNRSYKKKNYIKKIDRKGKIKFTNNYNINDEIIKDIKLNLDKYIFNFDESLLKFIKVKENYKKKYNEDFIKQNNPINENLMKNNGIQKNSETDKKFEIEIGTIELAWTNQDALIKNLMMNKKDSEYLLDHPPYQWKFLLEKNLENILSDDANVIKPSRRSSKKNLLERFYN